jgi:hypothetical protein
MLVGAGVGAGLVAASHIGSSCWHGIFCRLTVDARPRELVTGALAGVGIALAFSPIFFMDRPDTSPAGAFLGALAGAAAGAITVFAGFEAITATESTAAQRVVGSCLLGLGALFTLAGPTVGSELAVASRLEVVPVLAPLPGGAAVGAAVRW